jgi:hypothetical protein
MQREDYTIDACRNEIFIRLCEIWEETKEQSIKANPNNDESKQTEWQKDIWRKANTLQAVAYYWFTIKDDAALKQKAMDLMKDGYQFYIKVKNNKDLWVDDFGWWGGFFTDLHSYTSGQPNGRPVQELPPPFNHTNLISETEYCYDRMIKNLDKEYGGIWNNPKLNEKSCEKNSITNSWILNVSLDLFSLTKQQKYKDFFLAQYSWLTTGKYNGHAPPPQAWSLYTAEGLVLWIANGPNTRGPNYKEYEPQGYWSGDQGVFLRALSRYILSNPQMKEKLLADGRNLIAAAIATFDDPEKARFVDKEKVMHESARNPIWGNDLCTGKGVFMRLATRFVRSYDIGEELRAKFKEIVLASAQSAWCSRIPSSEKTKWLIAPNWNPRFGPSEEGEQQTTGDLWPQVFQTNGLDVLNAAVQISKLG